MSQAFFEKGTVRTVGVYEEIPVSAATWKQWESRYGPAITLTFMGSFVQGTGAHTILIKIRSQGRDHTIFYSVEGPHSTRIVLPGISLEVRAILYLGNQLQIVVP